MQHGIAHQMAVHVIDLLEVVRIQHQHGKRLPLTQPALHLGIGHLQRRAACEGAGQAIVGCQVLKL